MSQELPPGQRLGPFERFGLPRFAAEPRLPAAPLIAVSGLVDRPGEIDLRSYRSSDDRREQVSDLHCVTTWSAVGLRWGGVPFHIVHRHLADSMGIAEEAEWVRFRGFDGFRSSIKLEDALAENVLLADRLDGDPLGADHGAPLRLVAPRHYGYKSVKHVVAIEYMRHYDPGSAGAMVHPRGRVAREERSRWLPGWFWRPIWRSFVPFVRRRYRRADAGNR
ncbi:molybdopterin-dependent oxidoreductase [Glycomyces xiaoerkulensis]|uniref:molybdopterin-dependent oxidoreductase n=1 Tax=Glycomyces xiaoerkulensis TaxID=2038139 RepID=UPI000C259A5D|nr:molybdopterin-dependent oxidoreductase [Glycomyces xiaoerkulensis]